MTGPPEPATVLPRYWPTESVQSIALDAPHPGNASSFGDTLNNLIFQPRSCDMLNLRQFARGNYCVERRPASVSHRT